MPDTHYLDTLQGSFTLQRLMDRPCHYAPAFRITPTCVPEVHTDHGKLTPEGIRMGSFDSAELDHLFRNEVLAKDTLVIVPKYPSGHYKQLYLPPNADTGTPFKLSASTADIGREIASLGLAFGRTRIICATFHPDFMHDCYCEDQHDVYEASITNLVKAGCIVVRYDMAKAVRHNPKTGHDELTLAKDYITNAVAYDRQLAWQSYLAAIKTIAASNFEFLYQLFTTGCAVTNTTLQHDATGPIRSTAYLANIVNTAIDTSPVLTDAVKLEADFVPNLLGPTTLFTMPPAQAIKDLYASPNEQKTLENWWRVLSESRRLRNSLMSDNCRIPRAKTTDATSCFERLYTYGQTIF